MPRPSASAWLLAGLAGLAGLAVLHLWTPSGDPTSAVCLLRRLFHLPCPACGMTRAFAHLAKGEWAAAVAIHPLSPAVAIELVLGWAAWGISFASPLRLPVRADSLLFANAAALVAFWLGRAATGSLPW
jgi:hypothetical protein